MYGAGGAEIVEDALGNLGEHHIHGVGPDLRVHGRHLDNLCPVSGELIAEEPVRDVDLGDHIDEGQQLAEEEVDGVTPVRSQIFLEVSLDAHDLRNPLFLLQTLNVGLLINVYISFDYLIRNQRISESSNKILH